jgi:hypothetical protein
MTAPPTSSGAPGLEGYVYQLDISVWAALDLLLSKKLAQHITLEPVATKEDLEAELSDEQPGAAQSAVQLPGKRKLVIQVKFKTTGPWEVGGISRLLKHGTRRPSAVEQLSRDPDVHYVLVTSADVSGEARELIITSLGGHPKTNDLPKTIAKEAPTAGGRIMILPRADREVLAGRIQTLLESSFHVPHTSLEACKAELRVEAFARMQGASGGIWTRAQLEAIIEKHGGFFMRSAEAATFVKPTNWDAMKRTVVDENAIVITGTSGTGKTTAADMLRDELLDMIPGLKVVNILHGPEEVRAYHGVDRVLFMIEDPWGKYRLEPMSTPWNDEVGNLLKGARGDRRFIITSRSDVLAESGTNSLRKNWVVKLEAENYGRAERSRLFDHRFEKLPIAIQKFTMDYRAGAIDQLRSPLEMQKFFDNLLGDREADESDGQFVSRCLAAAHQNAIDQTLIDQVEKRNATAWAAVIWGLFKAGGRQSQVILSDIQTALADKNVALEDGLEPFVRFLVNSRNLRQVESTLSYAHPRVEGGLEAAMGKKAGLASRVLHYLLDAFVSAAIDVDGWGAEAAAHLVQALGRQQVVKWRVSTEAQAVIDAWLQKRLSEPGGDYAQDLRLAADAGSPDSTAAQVSKWLITTSRPTYSFGDNWAPDPNSPGWYQKMVADPLTATICDGFVRLVLPFERSGYPSDFADRIGQLAPGLAASFSEGAAASLAMGPNSNIVAIARGALKDLEASEALLKTAIDFLAGLAKEEDAGQSLAMRNGEFDVAYEEHLSESGGESYYAPQVVVEEFAKAYRSARGWQALRDHPRVTDLVEGWIALFRAKPSLFDDAEALALAEAAISGPSESSFWRDVEQNWRGAFASKLFDRVRDGHADSYVRHIVIRCFIEQLPSEYGELVSELTATNPSRLFEIFLDLQVSPAGTQPSAQVAAFITVALQNKAPAFVELAQALVSGLSPTPKLSDAALDVLRQVSTGENDAFLFEKAKLLAAAGADVVGMLAPLVASPRDDRDGSIGLAAASIPFMAALGQWSLVEKSLAHRFADVREAALVALAARQEGPLPELLIGLAKDQGSRVRKVLVNLLEQRPHESHIDALVILAADTWSDEQYYHGDPANYPIALQAIRVLTKPPIIPQRVFEQLLALCASSSDPDVAWNMMVALASNGGADGVSFVCDQALSRQNVRIATAAARALWLAGDKVTPETASRLTAENVTTRHEDVSVFMGLAIGRCGSEDQLIETAKALSARPRRCALLVPLVVGASENNDRASAVANFLPAEMRQAVLSTLAGGEPLARTALDGLGHVRIVQAIIRLIPSLFAKMEPPVSPDATDEENSDF